MSPKDTARIRREKSRAEWSRALAKVLLEYDVPQAEIARCIGVAPSKVQRWCDPESREMPGIADVALFPQAIRGPVLQLLCASMGFVAVENHAVSSQGSHLERLAEVSRTLGGVSPLYAEGLVDGTLDPSELRTLRAACTAAAQSALSLVEVCTEELSKVGLQ